MWYNIYGNNYDSRNRIVGNFSWCSGKDVWHRHRYGKNVYIGDADNIGRICFAGANIAFQGVFQALDGGMESLIVSVLRQIVFVLPVAYLLSLPVRNNSGKIWLVWLTFIFAEGMSLIISLLLMKKIKNNVINNVKEADYHE